jgi:hypothetical protein
MFGTEGVAVLKEVRSKVHEQEKVWMSSLSDAELQKLIKLLHQVQAALDESGL